MERKSILDILSKYLQQQLDAGKVAKLHFICTHNSRRSQLAQVWAHTAACYYHIPVECFSGGVEVTAFNERAVAALGQSGFVTRKTGQGNPHYVVDAGPGVESFETYSKLYDDPVNPLTGFAAVMTCSHADENCPFIPGADIRVPLHYEDPKEFDGLPGEKDAYSERSQQIATELFYAFSQVRR